LLDGLWPFFNLGVFCFFILGLFLGRLAALLTEAFLDLKKVDKGIYNFYLMHQKKWGYFPLSSLLKKIKGKKAIDFRPLWIELLMASLFSLLFFFVGWKYVLLEYLLFTFAIVVASAVDLKIMILPDTFTLSGIVIGLMGALLNPERDFLPALAGVLIGGGFLWFIAVFYYSLRKEEGLGGGDIKLLAWIGAILTWKAVPFVILLSCFIGLFTGVYMMFRSKNYLKQSIPFGPYLSLSALLYIFCGEELAKWYLSIFYL